MEELTPENIPIFGYPALTYTPRLELAPDCHPTKMMIKGKPQALMFKEGDCGTAMGIECHQRANLMWNKLSTSIVNSR